MHAHFCPFCRQTNDPAWPKCTACDGLRPSGGWPVDPLVGRVFGGKYRAESRLGAGGFGTVLLATQLHGDDDLGQVVLKVLHADLAHHDEVRQRFVNEARAARQLHGPHAVKVFDLDYDENGVPYIVMEYLAGTSLQDVLTEQGRLPLGRVLDIARQVAEALAECHELGIVHRDLKPDNILLLGGRRGDFVKILDFGIARVPSRSGPVTATLMGTPMYMPPEQLLQQPIDHRVDVFALGVILFECLTGQPPIEASSLTAYVIKNVQERPPRLRELYPEAPMELDALVDAMMAKAAEDRPADMHAVAVALDALSEGSTPGGAVGEARPPASPQTHVPGLVAAGAAAAEDDDDDEAVAFPRRRWGGLVALGAVLVIAVVAVIVWLGRETDRRGEAPSAARKGPTSSRPDAGSAVATPLPSAGTPSRDAARPAGPRVSGPSSPDAGAARDGAPGLAARRTPPRRPVRPLATRPRPTPLRPPPARVPSRPRPRPDDDPFGRVR